MRIATSIDSSCRPGKITLGRLLAKTPWTRFAQHLERKLGLMRVFNYHGTPERFAESFGRQVDLLLSRFKAIDPYELEEVLSTGPQQGDSLAAFTFDDGLENHFTVAASELEERGARGIFCIPAVFPSISRARQSAWFRDRVRSRPDAEHRTDEDCYAMSWEQARELISRGHRVCSHSVTHEVLSAKTDEQTLVSEIVGSRAQLESELETTVDGFCWPVLRDERATRALELVAATYRYSLVADTRPLRRGHSLLDVNRTRLEASWPLEAVEFQISGMMDTMFAAQRLREALKR
jgi:peptidoglycan/xylan/chitin deacetylase (PgdA/CDA1 family)